MGYCAIRPISGASSGTAATGTKDPSTGRRVRRGGDPDAVVIQEVPHLRIIDQDLWDRVSQRLAAKSLPPHRPSDKATTGFWDRRRPRHVLTGKVFCGCCGRAAANFGQDYLGCRAAKLGACRNTSTIRRGVIEARVLAALGGQLMQPELLDEFIAAYNEELVRLAAETKGQADVRRRERGSLERKIANLVDAVADGRANASLLAKIEELESQLARIPANQDEVVARSPALHPGLAETYRRASRGLAISAREGR